MKNFLLAAEGLVWIATCLASGLTATEPAGSFTIRADWFDHGNVRVSIPGEIYADQYACIWNGGVLPNSVEYELEFPVTADYTLVALYTAADSRRVDVFLNDVRLFQGFAGVTGSWQTSQARWEVQGTFPVTQGRHKLKLQCPGPCLPHICALRFESSQAFPANWKLARTLPRRRPRRVEAVCTKAHRVLEHGLAGKPLEIEVLRADESFPRESAANNELFQHPDGSREATTPWVARLSAVVEGDRLDSELLELSPRRLRQLLEHAQTLISDFRQMDGVDSAWLEAEWCESAALRETLDVLLREAETREKWRQFAELYVAAYGLRKRIALSNPLVNFDRLLVVRRGVTSPALGLPQNWQSNCALPTSGYNDEIGLLSLHAPAARVKTLYRPQAPVFVGDVDLHFDADRLLFSSVNNAGRWQVFEIQVGGTELRQVTPSEQPDIDNYDACYLPDGQILFCSTAPVTAVPCVNGSTAVANLYRIDGNGQKIRQLCFDQEHNWCPTVLESGRVLYLRWEYTDTPHTHDRVLFSMNPDGTEQREFYGSNSYWPNSLFYARPIPGTPGQFVGIVGGHHGVPRMGELVLFDVSRGRREAEGAVQQIPGRGKKVEARIEDQLVDDSWPKFLHPYPLSDKYFLVASQPGPGSLWGIYLVDRFDGMVLLKEEPGYALLEPIPLRKTPRPPVIPERIDPARKDALLYIADIYQGEGLRGIPRGTVKRLRLLTYHFLYPGMGGPQGVVGMEGPWDIKRIVGSVPVEEDGSALFRIPANTPISLQPLDAEGKALQLMRSWLTAMPGEVLSCVGCHDNPNSAPPTTLGLMASRPPAEITPWYGPMRGFNFAREVQPVLDEHCVCCHRPDSTANHDGRLADLRGTQWIQDYTSLFHHGDRDAGHFTVSYAELHRYVRRPGLESDYHTLVPLEFHADTTELVRMLIRGHHGVRLDAEAWDRLITWIDLNAPFHGTWGEIAGPDRVEHLAERRQELLRLYAGVDDDPEAIPPSAAYDATPQVPQPELLADPPQVTCAGWPMQADAARRRQEQLGDFRKTLDLGGGVTLDLVLIPPGEFVMGDTAGCPDERPPSPVRIERPFWIGSCEVTNQQFAAFDRSHDSRVEHRHAMQFGVRGFYVNGPNQPVVRVAWRHAMAFCEWLTDRTGRRFTLPTEAQWEYACRAGSDTAFFFGSVESDYSAFANLADITLSEFVCDPYSKRRAPFANPGKYDDWIPRDNRFNDGGFVSEDVGRYRSNPWGLYDVHGNVWEWTRSAYRPYPYCDDDGRNDPPLEERRTVRGGSWYDRPNMRAARRVLPIDPTNRSTTWACA